MKSNLPACFVISSASRDTTTSSAPRRSASSFAGRRGEDNDVGSERTGELDAHVTQPAEADHADLLALGDAPVAHGRVRRDPGAVQRRDPGRIEVGGDAQNEAFIDDDAVGVSAVGDAPEVLVRGTVGQDLVRAELLKAGLAMGACASESTRQPSPADRPA